MASERALLARCHRPAQLSRVHSINKRPDWYELLSRQFKWNFTQGSLDSVNCGHGAYQFLRHDHSEVFHLSPFSQRVLLIRTGAKVMVLTLHMKDKISVDLIMRHIVDAPEFYHSPDSAE